MNRFISKVKSPIEIIKLICKFEPLFVILSIFQIMIKASLPLLYVYFPKIFIELLTSQNIEYIKIAKTIFVYALILVFLNIFNLFFKNKIDFHADIFAKKVKNRIGNLSMQLKYQDIENPETQNLIKLANKVEEITNSLIYIQNIVASIMTVAGFIYLTLRFDFIFIILIFITLIVKIITVYIEYLHNKKMRKLLSENSRYIEYLFGAAFHNKGSAKEIRVNNLGKWYMDKNKKYRDEMVTLQYKSFKLNAFHNILNEMVLAVQSFIVLSFLAKSYSSNNISLGDFTLYFSAITSLTINISSITKQLSNYNQQMLNVNDYHRLNRLLNNDKNNEEQIHIPIDRNNIEIEFKNVSFIYPNSTKKVLNNINIKIKNKEKIGIVGLNGAGKTTFIKLLCKFYKPSEGVITLNGIDIWKIPDGEYYDLISAVFQDFSNFAFSIKENITMSEEKDDMFIYQILKKVDLYDKVNSLSNKDNTYLSKSFSTTGIELSGGQEQKLAIARCVYKNSPILILDEPTANLDPIAESEIYKDFFEMCKNKTAIFISHRLAVSTIVDKIVVFVNGNIVEIGSHKELMKRNGIYKEMFSKQSENYTSK